ncbi:MAG TPA: anthranilate phosphoribosyltransferase [Candidatus Acidoferrales bacterium]|nr:anthranilate phosphoribosyltransferase [Candidatus Acidoferrales bacterium]
MTHNTVSSEPGGENASFLRSVLRKLSSKHSLTRDEAAQTARALLDPETTDALIAAILVALVNKGETADELAGVADALVERMVHVKSIDPVLDTAGTGASDAKTFNVSTAAAFVIAGAGFAVAKHGGRAASSTSGSADVVRALGIKIPQKANAQQLASLAESELQQHGICFLFAPNHHPALARVAPIRRELGIRTTFNLVGPLVNPCLAPFRVLGVSDVARMHAVAEALCGLGARRAWVVRGCDGLDELTLTGNTTVLEVNGVVKQLDVAPEDFGLKRVSSCAHLRGNGPEENAAIIASVLDGSRRDAARDLVLLNAAAAIHVRTGEPLQDCTAQALKSIESGDAMRKLNALRANNTIREGAGA